MKEAINARLASAGLLGVSEDARNLALRNIARALTEKSAEIVTANVKDIEEAKHAGLSDALIDRLSLDESRIMALAGSVKDIANQDQVVNKIVAEIERENGLRIQEQQVPIGVLAMIFESRPNVVIDCSALAIKSGNAIILKGGKEASHSNQILAEIVNEAVENVLPKFSVQLVTSRDDVRQLLEQVESIDLVIPRGGEGLVKYVVDNSRIPVLAHYKGLCHIFIDKSANLRQAIDIVLNAKVQRPGVCNAVETVLIHKALLAGESQFILDLLSKLEDEGVELRLCDKCPTTEKSLLATEEDWNTEYLDKILSIKAVDDVQTACEHIKQYGSQHTEAILSSDQESINYFQQNVDASSVMINASTRFNDG
ncbi:MAG: glutamate-5-semialdehyde dehydrogenase, partial [Gammaproteobacteria bacterium]|nr:glutamate-5-semialdehyde dehydrogenase [Gammaproteobacteria bacterium]